MTPPDELTPETLRAVFHALWHSRMLVPGPTEEDCLAHVSAWAADRRDAALEKRDKLQRAEENVVLRVRIEALEKRLTETGVRVEDTLDDLSHVLDMLGATEEQLALSRYTLAQARSVASSANLTGHGDGNTGPTAALRGEEER